MRKGTEFFRRSNRKSSVNIPRSCKCQANKKLYLLLLPSTCSRYTAASCQIIDSITIISAPNGGTRVSEDSLNLASPDLDNPSGSCNQSWTCVPKRDWAPLISQVQIWKEKLSSSGLGFLSATGTRNHRTPDLNDR